VVPTPDQPAHDDDDLKASVLAAVQYVVKLKLPPAQWDRVAEIIEAALAAIADDDGERLRQAAGELMLITPVRIVKGDDKPINSADQRIFERANVLIKKLEPMRPDSSGKSDGKGR
jgi:CATRA-associated small protein